MAEAFLWGAIGASALLVGTLVAYRWNPSRTIIAIVMALGTGVLIGSVSFELIDEAVENTDVGQVGVITLFGAVAFTFGSWILERRGGGQRKDSSGAQASGSPQAIVLGSVLDGIPESFVLGLTVLQGQVSLALLAGVLLSNFPEGMSSSAGLRIAGWPLRRVMMMWTAVLVVSAISAALGYAVLEPGQVDAGAAAQSFAAGALLAMVSNTMLPEAFEEEGILTGSLVAVGFAVSLILSAL